MDIVDNWFARGCVVYTLFKVKLMNNSFPILILNSIDSRIFIIYFNEEYYLTKEQVLL